MDERNPVAAVTEMRMPVLPGGVRDWRPGTPKLIAFMRRTIDPSIPSPSLVLPISLRVASVVRMTSQAVE